MSNAFGANDSRPHQENKTRHRRSRVFIGRHGRGLFEDNAKLELLSRTHCAQFLANLGTVTQRDLLHQIAKLHDPTKQLGQSNLSIGFIIDNGFWDRETRMRLSMLKAKLDAFASLLKDARNKLTAHNDLATILAGQPLGQFPIGADIECFKNLQDLVDIVAGSPRPFNDLVRNDARLFVEARSCAELARTDRARFCIPGLQGPGSPVRSNRRYVPAYLCAGSRIVTKQVACV
jgi:hypothetical protein